MFVYTQSCIYAPTATRWSIRVYNTTLGYTIIELINVQLYTRLYTAYDVYTQLYLDCTMHRTLRDGQIRLFLENEESSSTSSGES